MWKKEKTVKKKGFGDISFLFKCQAISKIDWFCFAQIIWREKKMSNSPFSRD